MINSSKILTVSYGTFSCTLEGFDDSFETMKAIAEYFRDLAADDRYFGAEPPTPDAEMLARIAEREIERRVEARLEQGNIILRPSLDAPLAASGVAAAAAAKPAPAESAPAEAEAVSEDAVSEDAVSEDTVSEDTVSEDAAAAEEAQTVDDAAPEAEAVAELLAEEAPVAEAVAEQDDAADDETASPVEEATDKEEPATLVAATQADAPDEALAEAAEAVTDEAAEETAAETPADPADEAPEVDDAPEEEALAPETEFAPAEASEEDDSLASDAVMRMLAAHRGDATAAPVAEEEEHAGVEDAETAVVADADTAEEPEAAEDAQEPTAAEAPEVEEETQDEADSGPDLAALNAILNQSDDEDELDADEATAGADDDDAEDETFAQSLAALTAQTETDDTGDATENAIEDWNVDTAEDRGADADLAEEWEDENADAAVDDLYDEEDVFAQESDEAEDVAEEPAPATNVASSVAAKLQRIRDVVSLGAVAPSSGDETAYTEDEHADDALDLGEDDGLDSLAAHMADAVETDETEDDGWSVDDAADLDDAETADMADAEDEAEPETQTAAAPSIRARVMKVKRSALDAAVAEGRIEEVADEAETLPLSHSSTLSAEDEADLARELAEVEAELEGGDVADTPVEAEADAEIAEAEEEDGDLLDDLEDGDDNWAEAEAYAETEETHDDEWDTDDYAPTPARAEDLSDEFDDDDADEDEVAIERLAREGARKTVKLSSPARSMLTEAKIEEDEGSVSRLLDETNTQLDEPASKGRRSAIAHLRAAVAATRADRVLGKKRDEEEASEPYREDLANVVRPRRPEGGESRTERPRPAPLKLVAEQRVDDGVPPVAAQDTPAEPVRPRRVNTEAISPESDLETDSGFIAFAESVGASELPDLLEAAAAYMSFVEGQREFSRPQLMNKVRAAEADESSREDRLRSFGQLLREGKIEKAQGGRFMASPSISFKPERIAG